MTLDALITHLRYGTPYSGDAPRDTLDALDRLSEAEALAAVRTEDENATLTARVEELVEAHDELRDALTDAEKEIEELQEQVAELRG